MGTEDKEYNTYEELNKLFFKIIKYKNETFWVHSIETERTNFANTLEGLVKITVFKKEDTKYRDVINLVNCWGDSTLFQLRSYLSIKRIGLENELEASLYTCIDFINLIQNSDE